MKYDFGYPILSVKVVEFHNITAVLDLPKTIKISYVIDHRVSFHDKFITYLLNTSYHDFLNLH